MRRRPLRTIAVTAAALPVLAISPGAQADTTPRIIVVNSDHGLINCQRPYLNTAYGPVAQCAEFTGTYPGSDRARFGLYSPITTHFEPSTAWLAIPGNHQAINQICAADDGAGGVCVGQPTVNTAFGGGVRVTQYQATRGRWGWFNVVTQTFYAEGGWIAKGND